MFKSTKNKTYAMTTLRIQKYRFKGGDFMLIDMKIKNFLSYNDTEVFSMETGEMLTKYNSTHTFSHQRLD